MSTNQKIVIAKLLIMRRTRMLMTTQLQRQVLNRILGHDLLPSLPKDSVVVVCWENAVNTKRFQGPFPIVVFVVVLLVPQGQEPLKG